MVREFKRDKFIISLLLNDEADPKGGETFHILREDGAHLFTVAGDIMTCSVLELHDSQNRTSLGIYSEKQVTWKGMHDAFHVRGIDGDEQLGWLEKYEDEWNVFDRESRQLASAKKNRKLKKFLKEIIKQRPRKPSQLPETHDFVFRIGDKKIGRLTRISPYIDRYELDLPDDILVECDRRLALALAILLVCKGYTRFGVDVNDPEAACIGGVAAYSLLRRW